MSRSSPPASSTDPPSPPPPNDLLQQIRAAGAAGGARPAAFRPAHSHLYTWIAASLRWLHIYVSLLGFTALMFFAVTGITLNHPTWFGADTAVVTDLKGTVSTEWLHLPPAPVPPVAEGEEPAEIDYSREIDRLLVVEHLRNAYGVRGAVAEFRVDQRECMILFKGPAYSVDVYLNRETGEFTGSKTTMGAVALINDLHKGRDTGPVWSLVIDLTALLMVFTSITGLALIFYLKRRRWWGLLTAVAGTVVFVVLYVVGVP